MLVDQSVKNEQLLQTLKIPRKFKKELVKKFSRGTFNAIRRGILVIDSYGTGFITRYSRVVQMSRETGYFNSHQMNPFCSCRRIKQKEFEKIFGSRY
jgi:hypothetical protein